MVSIYCKIIEVCVFKFENDQPHYLLLHRVKEETIYPGIWQFVSGSVEDGERATEAALRELEEETRLKPIAFWVVPHISSFYDQNYDALNFSPLFAAQIQSGIDAALSKEHDEYKWLSYDDARTKLVWPAQREGLRIVHEYLIKGQEAATLTRIF